MEFIIRPQYDHLGKEAQMFTYIMYQIYAPPPGLDADSRKYDDDFEDDDTLETFNADKLCDNLANYLDEMYVSYGHGHVLIPFGGDFEYANAYENFHNNDRLIAYFNKKYG